MRDACPGKTEAEQAKQCGAFHHAETKRQTSLLKTPNASGNSAQRKVEQVFNLFSPAITG
jgi:hypothetical protein